MIHTNLPVVVTSGKEEKIEWGGAFNSTLKIVLSKNLSNYNKAIIVSKPVCMNRCLLTYETFHNKNESKIWKYWLVLDGRFITFFLPTIIILFIMIKNTYVFPKSVMTNEFT